MALFYVDHVNFPTIFRNFQFPHPLNHPGHPSPAARLLGWHPIQHLPGSQRLDPQSQPAPNSWSESSWAPDGQEPTMKILSVTIKIHQE